MQRLQWLVLCFVKVTPEILHDEALAASRFSRSKWKPVMWLLKFFLRYSLNHDSRRILLPFIHIVYSLVFLCSALFTNLCGVES